MTITVFLTNPAEHQPSELRALAHFLNCLAADREGGDAIDLPKPVAPAIIPEAPTPQAPTHEGPEGEIPNAPASTPVPAVPGETAPQDSEASSPLDVNGVTYDERIHSATKSKNADGSWRQKRGVDPELVKVVLIEQQGAETVPDIPNVPAVPETIPVVGEVPDAPAASAVLPADVIKFVTGNKIEAAQALEVYSAFGLKNAAGLFSQPELAGDVLDAMRQLVG